MKSCWDLKHFGWAEFGSRLWEISGRLMAQAAQLSFYLILSIFPFLLFATALAGYILRSGSALHDLIQHHLHAVAPDSVANLIDSTLAQVSQRSSGGKLSFGLIFSLWAASTGMVALMQGLNMAYGVDEARRWWKQRIVSLGLTIGFLCVLIVALVLLLYGPRLIVWAGNILGSGASTARVWTVVQWLLLLVLVLFAFNVLYTIGPNVKHRDWHWLMPGTLAGVFLWLAVSGGFKLYLHFFNTYSATYGSLGAGIILLVWLYLSGLAILVGGELNSALEQRESHVEKKEG